MSSVNRLDKNTWQRLQDLFLDALERAPEERAAYLREACAGDDRLRGEIESMLEAQRHPAGLAIERTLLNERAGDAPAPLDPASGSPGARVGPWRLERLLGKGGMGEVWLAERADGAYEQRAAVKLVRPGWRAAELASRFRRERQVLARLAHPNIARLLDGGLTTAGFPYLAMEHVDGEPVNVWCGAPALSVRERVRIFRTICDAVGFAHANLVVHRDLKPANILVTNDGRPILLDFGIAKLLDPQDTDQQTRPDDRLLTPEYAAPEQIQGEPTTTATDVFALGRILRELLEDKAMDRDLSSIVSMALRDEPERRYRSAGQLAEDVDRWLGGLPVRAQPDTVGYRMRKFARRNRVAVAAASTIAALLVAFAALSLVQERRTARERDRAVAAHEDSEQAIAMLVDLFSVANPRVTPGGDTLRVDDLVRLMSGKIAESKESPRVRAKLWSTIADIHGARTMLAEAESATIRGIEAAEEGNLEKEALTLKHQRARVVHGRDGWRAAEPLYRESVRAHEALYGPNHEEVAPALQDWASTLDDREEAGRILDRVLGITLRHPDNPVGIAAAYNAIGSNHWNAGRYDKAREGFEKAYGKLAEMMGPDHVDLLAVRNNLAICEGATGRFADSEVTHRAVLEGRRKVFGDDSYFVGVSWMNIGVSLAMQGRFDEAVDALRKSVTITSKAVGLDHPEVIAVREDLGAALVRGGHPEEGFAIYDQLEATQRAKFGPESGEVIHVVIGRMNAQLFVGQRVPIDSVRVMVALLRGFERPGLLWTALHTVGLSALASPDEANPGEAETAFREALVTSEKGSVEPTPSVHFLRMAIEVSRANSGRPYDRELLAASLEGCESYGLSNPPVLRRAREILGNVRSGG